MVGTDLVPLSVAHKSCAVGGHLKDSEDLNAEIISCNKLKKI